jgi:hypothetical protein
LAVSFLAALAFSARTLAHLALVAAMILARPSLLKRRLPFGGVATFDGSVWPLVFAHRALWAAAILARASALIRRLPRRVLVSLTISSWPWLPDRNDRSSAIF